MENNKFDISKIIMHTISGDGYEENELIEKLEIIQKIIPFKKVEGYYNVVEGVYLNFDSGLVILGTFDEEPFNVRMIYKHKTEVIDIHPFGSLGGLDSEAFKNEINRAICTLKSPEASMVLQLMDKDYEYGEALRMTVKTCNCCPKELEKELNLYI